MDQTRVNIRPGVSVLSVLRHLNYKPWYAMAEFVDNSIQSGIASLDTLRVLHGPNWKLRVSIDIDSAAPGRITIRDNAAGIDFKTFPRAFRPAVVPPDRTGLSEFGMGMKSAACWFAARWHVRTKALGETAQRTVKFDIAKIVLDDIEELEIETVEAEKQAHFTELVLEDLYTVPVGRTLGKIKEHLADIYRVFIRDGSLELRMNGEVLEFHPPSILVAPYYKEPDGPKHVWRKDIEFDLGGGMTVRGFAALLDPGNYSRSGFALFRRNRLVEGSGEEGYRPPLIFGRSGRNSFTALRLFGELHLEGFQVSHTKDGFRWDENEGPFLELLKDHLDEGDLALLKQCLNYRALAAKKDRISAATIALDRTGDAMMRAIADVLPAIADQEPIETQSAPLDDQPSIAIRELRFKFKGDQWLVRMELSEDPNESEWLTISDTGPSGELDIINIRVAMAHPFMVTFAQTDPDEIDPLLRLAAAIALAEKLARRSGVKSAGTLRRNMNQILREALSQL